MFNLVFQQDGHKENSHWDLPSFAPSLALGGSIKKGHWVGHGLLFAPVCEPQEIKNWMGVEKSSICSQPSTDLSLALVMCQELKQEEAQGRLTSHPGLHGQGWGWRSPLRNTAECSDDSSIWERTPVAVMNVPSTLPRES